MVQNDLVNFDNLELLGKNIRKPKNDCENQDEDFSNFTLKQAISRLFKFIEIESNISLERLDGTY